MKRILLLIPLLSLFIIYTSAQCGANEIEIKVEIATDNWGSETSWKLTDLRGAIIMEGGKEGVYGNLLSYSDSICVAVDGCFSSRYMILMETESLLLTDINCLLTR
ncbi:MAG: hypothetical protein IPI60_15070 [Saprospiraceae bacterium]|nr:hypothetical protein [Saprospiraceae bacterium]